MRAICLSILLATCLVACSSPELPPVANATQLVTDSENLKTDGVAHQIPHDKWPASIVALNPISVSREDDGVHITTFAETGVGSRGYLISTTKPVSAEHFTFSETEYPNIYRFDFNP